MSEGEANAEAAENAAENGESQNYNGNGVAPAYVAPTEAELEAAGEPPSDAEVQKQIDADRAKSGKYYLGDEQKISLSWFHVNQIVEEQNLAEDAKSENPEDLHARLHWFPTSLKECEDTGKGCEDYVPSEFYGKKGTHESPDIANDRMSVLERTIYDSLEGKLKYVDFDGDSNTLELNGKFVKLETLVEGNVTSYRFLNLANQENTISVDKKGNLQYNNTIIEAVTDDNFMTPTDMHIARVMALTPPAKHGARYPNMQDITPISRASYIWGFEREFWAGLRLLFDRSGTSKYTDEMNNQALENRTQSDTLNVYLHGSLMTGHDVPDLHRFSQAAGESIYTHTYDERFGHVYAAKNVAKDLVNLMEKSGTQKVNLLGFSLGSWTMMELMSNPEYAHVARRISKATFVGANPEGIVNSLFGVLETIRPYEHEASRANQWSVNLNNLHTEDSQSHYGNQKNQRIHANGSSYMRTGCGDYLIRSDEMDFGHLVKLGMEPKLMKGSRGSHSGSNFGHHAQNVLQPMHLVGGKFSNMTEIATDTIYKDNYNVPTEFRRAA